MHFFLSLLFFILFSTLASAKRDYGSRLYYTLHTEESINVQKVVDSLGARYEGPVGELAHYHWISIPNTKTDLMQQFDKHRLNKRAWQTLTLTPQIPSRRIFKRAPPPIIENILEEQKFNNETISLPSLNDTDGYEQIKNLLNMRDPGFDQQWHLINRDNHGHDLNVTGVWNQGITGKNVVVAIVDDGLELHHKDLSDNYFAEGSYDFNLHEKEPLPRLADDTHGTRCAGEIAAVKNDICGVGVAYDAKVAGIRILSGTITQADEAAAINHEYQKNHIYSCSWGPQDSGEVAQAPEGIILDAIKNGIQHGRNGTGSIFVFASGNGGGNDDNCNFDGYTNSIYTITVGAVDKMGLHPYYSERCAAQLVVTYSSGSGGYIYTTNVGDNQCANNHGGTSAAAPLAAGVFALVLSIRPDLTWRDMQHLCVQSAVPISTEDTDWVELPSGRMFNHKYGYGSLDAYRIVELAKTFQNVGPQTSVEIASIVDPENPKIPISDLTPATANATVDLTNAFRSTLVVTQEMVDKMNLGRLEHVTATVNIEHQRRGDLEILLESPHQVISQLGTPRRNDKSTDGLLNWTFMTVKHWEEDPVGNWTLSIFDARNADTTGQFLSWKLTLWGEVSVSESDNDTLGMIEEAELEQASEKPHNQSFLDQNITHEQKDSGPGVALYSAVILFMIASLASTAFIVKKYMLSATNIGYTRPTEEDAFEFDNLITEEQSFNDDLESDIDQNEESLSLQNVPARLSLSSQSDSLK